MSRQIREELVAELREIASHCRGLQPYQDSLRIIETAAKDKDKLGKLTL